MKRTLILFFAFGLIACDHGDSLLQTNIGKTVTVDVGGKVTIHEVQMLFPFSVLVTEISDSRCPIGVMCIWGGEASAKFKIESDVFWLKVGESKEFKIDQRSYRITLKDVVPYPVYQNYDVKKQAVFIVERI